MKEAVPHFFKCQFSSILLVAFVSVSLLQMQAASSSPSRTPSRQLSASPSSMSFGSTAVGKTITQSARVTNLTSSALTITRINVPKGFAISGLATGIKISAGQSVAFSMTFAPSTAGTISGSVSITAYRYSWRTSTTAYISVDGTGVLSGQLIPSPTGVNFGTVTTSTTSSQSVQVTNSGSSTATISQIAASGSGFSAGPATLPVSLSPGQSTTFKVMFTPASTGTVSGGLQISSNASNPSLNVALTGTGVSPVALSINPTSVSFGSVQVGTSKAQSAVVMNSGGSSVSISNMSVSGNGFTASGLTVPLTLAAGQSASFSISFSPQATGAVNGSVTLASSVSVPPIALSGSGTAAAQLSASPTALSFGNVAVGTTGTQSSSLRATGGNVTVAAASATDTEFSISGLTLPITIAAGTSVPFNVVFAPRSSGTATANLTFSSSAPTSPTVGLTGSGTTPPLHSVMLSWSSDGTSLSGYNVYRGAAPGGPYTQINALEPNTMYTDETVRAGTTYYYVVTAVGSTGVESAYSNQVQAVIPTP